MIWYNGITNGPLRDHGANWQRCIWSRYTRKSQAGEEEVCISSNLLPTNTSFPFLVIFVSNLLIEVSLCYNF